MNRRITMQHVLQSRTCQQQLLQCIHTDAKTFACDLHDRAVRASPEADCYWDWRKSFVSHDADFNAFSAPSCENQGSHAGIQEVDVILPLVGLIQAFALWQIKKLQVWPDAVKFVVRNREKDGIS